MSAHLITGIKAVGRTSSKVPAHGKVRRNRQRKEAGEGDATLAPLLAFTSHPLPSRVISPLSIIPWSGTPLLFALYGRKWRREIDVESCEHERSDSSSPVERL